MTHHNALDRDLYLRIATELYLKRCIVGGLERVYELGKDFRNEGVSRKHNPEFTMVETYEAYADYRDVAEMLEQLVAARRARGDRGTTVPWKGAEIDLAPPWRRLDVREALAEASGSTCAGTPTPARCGPPCARPASTPPTARPGRKLVDGLLSRASSRP